MQKYFIDTDHLIKSKTWIKSISVNVIYDYL